MLGGAAEWKQTESDKQKPITNILLNVFGQRC